MYLKYILFIYIYIYIYQNIKFIETLDFFILEK